MNGITFPLSKIKQAIERIKDVIHGLNHYVDQINTITHNYYNISDKYFHDDSIYKKSSDMRITCEKMFQIQHLMMKKVYSFV